MLLRLCLVFAHFRKIPPEEMIKMHRHASDSENDNDNKNSSSDADSSNDDDDDDDDDYDKDSIKNKNNAPSSDNLLALAAGSSSPQRGRRKKTKQKTVLSKHKQKRRLKTKKVDDNSSESGKLKIFVMKLLGELKELWMEINMQLDLSGKLNQYIQVPKNVINILCCLLCVLTLFLQHRKTLKLRLLKWMESC